MREITLTKGYVAIVDDEDYERVNQWKWCITSTHRRLYVVRGHWVNGEYKRTYLHRFIMDAPHGVMVDHKDGNVLNNTRDNLRLATSSQNNWNRKINVNNTAGYKGVSWNKRYKKFVARISADKKEIHLGTFYTAIEAHRAYCEAALRLHGEFANFGTTQEHTPQPMTLDLQEAA